MVRRIREFNYSLLGKWCWRLLVERDGFWFRVVAARYGVVGGRLVEGGRNTSTWWQDICALRGEEWFSGHISRSVGDDKHTLFWSDEWIGGVYFRIRFSRLFDLSLCKEESVFDMCRLGVGN